MAKKIICFVFGFILFIFSLFSLIHRNNQNSEIRSSFQLPSQFANNYQWSDYQEHIPLSEMDIEQYRALFTSPVNPVGYETAFVTEQDLWYYEEINGTKTEAFCIPAGTEIDLGNYLHLSSDPTELGAGFASLPTYEKGWRWVRPFATAYEEGAQDSEGWYYCNLSDLESLAHSLLESSESLREALTSSGMDVDTFCHAFVCQVDLCFYREGVYESPDLFYSVWTLQEAVLLILAALFVIVGVLSKEKKRERERT